MAGRYGLEIRAADAADAPGLAELFACAGRPLAAPGLARRLERLREDRGTVLVAVEGGPPTGVAVLTRRARLEADAPIASLDLLLVNPADRRRGVGRLLLKAAAQAARAAGCTELGVIVADEAALRAFCLASGFAEAGGVLVRLLRKRAD